MLFNWQGSDGLPGTLDAHSYALATHECRGSRTTGDRGGWSASGSGRQRTRLPAPPPGANGSKKGIAVML